MLHSFGQAPIINSHMPLVHHMQGQSKAELLEHNALFLPLPKTITSLPDLKVRKQAVTDALA